MNTRDNFRAANRMRKLYEEGTAERNAYTRTARKMAWIHRRVPSIEWEERIRKYEEEQKGQAQ